jgi:hypothetical protein
MDSSVSSTAALSWMKITSCNFHAVSRCIAFVIMDGIVASLSTWTPLSLTLTRVL